MVSSSSTSSSSSSSSLMESGVSTILLASAWNREKERRPVRPHNDDSEEKEKEALADKRLRKEQEAALLLRRVYPSLVIPSSKSAGNGSSHTDDEPETDISNNNNNIKSEIEASVLKDCLSTNFLFHHLPNAEIEGLLSKFEKIQARKHELIVQQGDPSLYFYMLYIGAVKTFVDGQEEIRSTDTSEDERYTVFGELEVLTNAPRHRSTVKVTSPSCTLFRLSRVHYQQALQQPSASVDSSNGSSSQEERMSMLQTALPEELAAYLQDDRIALQKLVSGMSSHRFQKGQVLFHKHSLIKALVIVETGLITATDVSMGGRPYEDMTMGPAEAKNSFGWQSILSSNTNNNATTKRNNNTINNNERMTGTIIGASDGTVLVIPKTVFVNALGNDVGSLHLMAQKRLARVQLQEITIFKDSALTAHQINGLLDSMHLCEYDSEEEEKTFIKIGEKVDAAMYFVRKGSVTLLKSRGTDQEVIRAGGYFGEKNMLLDQNKDGHKHFEFRSPYAAVATPNTKIDILYLEDCRKVINTTVLGLGQPATINPIDQSIRWSDIERHNLLGAGSYGQVYLASTPEETTEGRRMVALKIQAKHYLAESKDRAERAAAERNIMASLHSPFIIRLLASFQDSERLYMVTTVMQGGELESLIPQDGLSEGAAKFYAAGILEGVSYMHRHHIVHRDLKPENVLIDEKGYPVLIDLGFAKYVPDKTYTFCGSPMMTAPEIIRCQGYDRGCDNWSWAVLVFRLVTGDYPFYQKGLDELGLYKRICLGRFELTGGMSIDFRMLMVALLYPDPTQRLGSRVNGWRDIFAAPWFSNGRDDDDEHGFDLSKLRKQSMTAPWVPDLKTRLDSSRFHPDASVNEDLMTAILPGISEEQQHIFSSFGAQIEHSQ